GCGRGERHHRLGRARRAASGTAHGRAVVHAAAAYQRPLRRLLSARRRYGGAHSWYCRTAARGSDRGARHTGVLVALGLRPTPGMVVSAPRLTVEDLSYGYPGHVVGHRISFTVGAGEVLCVLGRNGEGKSTLFKTILGLLPPRAGTLRVDGEPTVSLDFGNQVRVLDAVRSLAQTRALSVLLSTHHPEQAFACADRVAVLAGGELLRIGAPAEVVTAETLRACYSVEVAVLPVADDRYRVCVPRSYLS